MMLRWVLLAVLLGAAACAGAAKKGKKVVQKKPPPLSRGEESDGFTPFCFLCTKYLEVWQ